MFMLHWNALPGTREKLSVNFFLIEKMRFAAIQFT